MCKKKFTTDYQNDTFIFIPLLIIRGLISHNDSQMYDCIQGETFWHSHHEATARNKAVIRIASKDVSVQND